MGNIAVELLRYHEAALLKREAEFLEGDFYEFVKAAWPQFDPATFSENWHLEDICDHMQMVANGFIRRGLFNEPPRTGKTALISICFTAWVWAQREKAPLKGPHVSFFYASYAEQLSLEHSIKCRRLIESRWYQDRWRDRFQLLKDRNRAGHFENTKGGYRMASSVDAKATGYGADILVADDPHLVKEAESETVREDTVKWWSETMPSRLNDRKTGAMIVVMQRVHEGDLSGDILLKDAQARKRDRLASYVHFCVPMSYVPCSHVNVFVDQFGVPCPADDASRIATFIGGDADEVPEEAVFWRDKRTEEGELLWHDRYPATEVSLLEHELGPYAFCTPAESPVLMADLSMKPIGQVEVGDSVVGFETGNDVRRARLKPAKIVAISKSLRPVVRLTLDSGETVRCTADHKWFTGRNDVSHPPYKAAKVGSPLRRARLKPAKIVAISKSLRPVVRLTLDSGETLRCTADHKWFTGRNDVSHPPYKAAKVGSPLRRVCPPSLPDLTSDEDVRLAGWVGGFFDGEGSVSLMHRRSGEGSTLISFTQTAERNLPLCQKLEAALSHFGFNYGVHERQPTTLSAAGTPWQRRRSYHLNSDAGVGSHNGPSRRTSRLTMNQRFLHVVQPTKWRERIIETTTNGRMYTTSERVISIEPDGVETVYGLTTETGNYVVWGLASSNSGQYQQTPAPRGGGIIREEWWQPWDEKTAAENSCAANVYPPFEYLLASLDTAYTEKEENDPSALSIWGVWRDAGGNPKLFLVFCWQERMKIHDLVKRVGADCKKYKVDRVIIEDKAAGHSVSQELARIMGHFDFGIELVNPKTGFIKTPDKSARLQTVVHLFAEGLVYAPDKEWADEMIAQVALVPRAIHDDLADTCSMALIYLRRAGWAQRKEERELEIADETRYTPRSMALYPV